MRLEDNIGSVIFFISIPTIIVTGAITDSLLINFLSNLFTGPMAISPFFQIISNILGVIGFAGPILLVLFIFVKLSDSNLFSNIFVSGEE